MKAGMTKGLKLSNAQPFDCWSLFCSLFIITVIICISEDQLFGLDFISGFSHRVFGRVCDIKKKRFSFDDGSWNLNKLYYYVIFVTYKSSYM